jgi:hypothetical protein
MLTKTVLKRMDGKLTCSGCRSKKRYTNVKSDARGVAHFFLGDSLVAADHFGEVLCRSCLE